MLWIGRRHLRFSSLTWIYLAARRRVHGRETCPGVPWYKSHPTADSVLVTGLWDAGSSAGPSPKCVWSFSHRCSYVLRSLVLFGVQICMLSGRKIETCLLSSVCTPVGEQLYIGNHWSIICCWTKPTDFSGSMFLERYSLSLQSGFLHLDAENREPFLFVFLMDEWLLRPD